MSAHPSITSVLPCNVVVGYGTTTIEVLASGAMMAAPTALSEED